MGFQTKLSSRSNRSIEKRYNPIVFSTFAAKKLILSFTIYRPQIFRVSRVNEAEE